MQKRLSLCLAMTVLAAVVIAPSTGCSWSVGGSKSKTSSGTPTRPPTRGQELIDLQKAHEAGAISDQEYEQMKRRLMNP